MRKDHNKLELIQIKVSNLIRNLERKTCDKQLEAPQKSRLQRDMSSVFKYLNAAMEKIVWYCSELSEKIRKETIDLNYKEVDFKWALGRKF